MSPPSRWLVEASTKSGSTAPRWLRYGGAVALFLLGLSVLNAGDSAFNMLAGGVMKMGTPIMAYRIATTPTPR